MARDRFNPITGGLLDSVVAGLGNDISGLTMSLGGIGVKGPGVPYDTGATPGSGITLGSGDAIADAGAALNQGLTANFAIDTVLGSAIQNSTGYVLNEGENYLLSQLGSVIPPSEYSQLTNAVVTQIAAAGIDTATNFISGQVSSWLGFSQAPNVTTQGLAGMGATSSKGIAPDVVGTLPQAQGGSYDLTDIVFSLVPANTGAQTAVQSQTNPSMDWTQGFSADTAGQIPAVDALKGQGALAGAGSGLSVGGKNFGSFYSAQGAQSGAFSGAAPLKSAW